MQTTVIEIVEDEEEVEEELDLDLDFEEDTEVEEFDFEEEEVAEEALDYFKVEKLPAFPVARTYLWTKSRAVPRAK